jgi:hypothetical protein
MAATPLKFSGSSTFLKELRTIVAFGAYQKLFQQESMAEKAQWAFMEKIYHGDGSNCPFVEQAVAG